MRTKITLAAWLVLALGIAFFRPSSAQMPNTQVRMSTGNGASDSGTQRVILATDSPGGTAAATSTVDPTIAAVTYTTAPTNAALIAAPSAGTRIVVLDIWISSSTTANVSVLIGFHATVTPATGTGRVFSHAGISTTNGGHKQLGGSAIGVGGDGVPLLITTGTIADGSVMVDVLYIVEAVP